MPENLNTFGINKKMRIIKIAKNINGTSKNQNWRTNMD